VGAAWLPAGALETPGGGSEALVHQCFWTSSPFGTNLDTNGDLVYTFTHPWSDGTTGIRLSPMELLEKLAALVPLPHMHLVRYRGCLAPHSHLRGAIIPTPRQQGVEDEEEMDTGSPRWGWARLLKRVFALYMARCP
jgi:hypothetical protein